MRKLNYAHHLRKCFADLRPSQTQRAVVAVVCGERKVGRVSSSREEGKTEASQRQCLGPSFPGKRDLEKEFQSGASWVKHGEHYIHGISF